MAYDISGSQVALLIDTYPAGELLLSLDGSDNTGESLGHGIYFAVVTVDDRQLVQRIVRLN